MRAVDAVASSFERNRRLVNEEDAGPLLSHSMALPLAYQAVSVLRATCGGGDIVIRADGTLWRSVMPEDLNTAGPVRHIVVVPVDGAS